MDLAGDEESSVRLAAFNTIINLMEVIDSGESSDYELFSQTKTEIKVLLIVSSSNSSLLCR